MDTFLAVVQTITDNLFSQVSLLIGLIALIGLALQRKPVEEVVAGTLRATIGVVILNIGVDIFVGGLVSFQAIVSSAMGLQAPSSQSSLTTFMDGAGSVVPLIIAGGFVFHLILVRIFPAAKFVYLTGHLMYWMAVVIAASMVEAFGQVDRWTLAGAGALIIGCYWVLQPLWMGPLMRRVMGDDEVGLAHTTSTLALAAGYGAKALKLGDPKQHNSENLKLPKAVSFFKDINVSTAFVIGVIMLVAIAFANPEVVAAQMEESAVAPWVWGLLQALRFAAGIAILLFGVRMFLAEIVPAFKGLSETALPGSKPALDIPVTFTKAPTSVMVGFLSSTVMFLLLMGLFALTGWFVLVPPMIMLFFGGGAGGVFGNAVAGWRGAVFGGALNGILLAFGQWFSWGLYSGTAPELATLADPDWFAVGWLVVGLGNLLAPLGSGGVWLLAGVAVLITVVVLVLIGRRPPRETTTEPEPALVGAGADDGATAAQAVPVATEAGAAARPQPLTVLAVCGAGMGSSLILRTTAERALKELGVEYTISHADSGSARSQRPDVVIAQPTYLDELGALAPVMVPIENFVNVPHVRDRLRDGLAEKGVVVMQDLAAYVDRVLTHNADAVGLAADAVVATGRRGGLVLPAGAGHSLAAVLETFFRAGGLAFVRPIWDESILPLVGARAATAAERVPGSGRAVAEKMGIEARDTVVVFSNSGVNPFPVEVAQAGLQAGATVVAFTSLAASAAAPARSGEQLASLATIVLDTLVPPGDATWPPDAPVTSPVSSLATTALWAAVLRGVYDRWPRAPRWRSANMPGTDDDNARVLEEFIGRIPEL